MFLFQQLERSISFTYKNWARLSASFQMCAFGLFCCYFAFPDQPLRKKGKRNISLCFLIDFPISDAVNSRETALLQHLLWVADVSGRRSVFFHPGSCCGQTQQKKLLELRALEDWPSGGNRYLASFLGFSGYCEIQLTWYVQKPTKICQILQTDLATWNLYYFFALTLSIPDKGVLATCHR